MRDVRRVEVVEREKRRWLRKKKKRLMGWSVCGKTFLEGRVEGMVGFAMQEQRRWVGLGASEDFVGLAL